MSQKWSEGKTERVVVVQPGKGKIQGRPYCSISVLKRELIGQMEKTFSRACFYNAMGSGFKLKYGKFRLALRKKIFTMRVM